MSPTARTPKIQTPNHIDVENILEEIIPNFDGRLLGVAMSYYRGNFNKALEVWKKFTKLLQKRGKITEVKNIENDEIIVTSSRTTHVYGKIGYYDINDKIIRIKVPIADAVVAFMYHHEPKIGNNLGNYSIYRLFFRYKGKIYSITATADRCCYLSSEELDIIRYMLSVQ